jgi:hypothetical protein
VCDFERGAFRNHGLQYPQGFRGDFLSDSIASEHGNFHVVSFDI